MFDLSDLDEGRLNKAKELGADFIIKVDLTEDSSTLAKRVEDSLQGLADRTIECTGAESSFHTAITVSLMNSIIKKKELRCLLVMLEELSKFHLNCNNSTAQLAVVTICPCNLQNWLSDFLITL